MPIPPPPPQNNSSLPPLPIGADLPPGLSCPDAISRTLNTLPPAQLLDILSQMKTLTTTDPAKATELLRQAPQLSYAIFQALLLMGLVTTTTKLWSSTRRRCLSSGFPAAATAHERAVGNADGNTTCARSRTISAATTAARCTASASAAGCAG
jgi:hypothetical protein